MRCPRCSADNLAGMKVLRTMRSGAGRPLSVLRLGQSSRTPVLRPMRRAAGPPGLQEAVAPRAICTETRRWAPRITLPGEMKQVTVLFCDIVGSTPAHRTARGRGDARPRQLVSGHEPCRGASLWRNRAAIYRRWIYGAVRRPGDAGRPRTARIARRLGDPAGARRDEDQAAPIIWTCRCGSGSTPDRWCSAQSPKDFRWIIRRSATPPMSRPGSSRPPRRRRSC